MNDTQPNIQYAFNGQAIRVIDGDTILAEVDLGLRIYSKQPLRLVGIDAPERGKEGWPEAKAHLEQLIGDGRIVVQTYKNPTDKYGRWLATIWKDGKNLNAAMVEDGHAIERTYA